MLKWPFVSRAKHDDDVAAVKRMHADAISDLQRQYDKKMDDHRQDVRAVVEKLARVIVKPDYERGGQLYVTVPFSEELLWRGQTDAYRSMIAHEIGCMVASYIRRMEPVRRYEPMPQVNEGDPYPRA